MLIVVNEDCFATPDRLTARCLIGGYKAPRNHEFGAGPLPVTSVGKVRKNALRDPHWAGRGRKI